MNGLAIAFFAAHSALCFIMLVSAGFRKDDK